VTRRTSCLFHWHYADGFDQDGQPVTRDGVEGTLTRAGKQRTTDSNGRIAVVPYGHAALHYKYASGVWAPAGVRCDAASTNVCLRSEDFGTTWAATGTPTRTAQAARCGSVYLDLIGDDDGAALEYYSQTITFTGNAVKTVSLFIREGTSTSTVVRLRDTTAPANRLLFAITWSGGTPTVTMTTGTNLLATPERLQDVNGNSVWRVFVQATTVTAANTNVLEVYPATNASLVTTSTGNVYIGGVQAQNAEYVGPYVPTTVAAASSIIDALTFPVSWLPRDITIYVKGVDLGTFQVASARAFQVGDDDSGTASSAMISSTGSGDAKFQHENASTAVDSDVTSGAIALHDTIELRFPVLAAGYTAGRSINGAAEVLGDAAAANTHQTTYAESVLSFTPSALSGLAIEQVKIAIGERTLAQMQAAV
jgi:hypothetical protein